MGRYAHVSGFKTYERLQLVTMRLSTLFADPLALIARIYLDIAPARMAEVISTYEQSAPAIRNSRQRKNAQFSKLLN